MPLSLLAALVVAALWLGYRFYSRFLAHKLQLSETEPTPAARLDDGVDFVPTRPFYLLGQHLASIAAAGPIVGPILACQQFGWLPAVLWIGLGVIFIGAVHDLAALVASVRHQARSIAEVIGLYLGPRAGAAMLAFIWVALLYVIVAFADVTASTFVAGDPELAGQRFAFNQGGAVAASSIFYLALAMAMGMVDRLLKPPLWLQTVIFVPAIILVVWLGTRVSTVFVFEARTWAFLIFGYCFLASQTPIWALLQPRGYLGGFVLYLTLALGVVGIFLGGFPVEQPAFRGARVPGETGMLFPFLFVTIACGACSGFHGLVCSGTTSKQIARETHCRPVGYGAMLLEAVVALIALSTVMILAQPEAAGQSPGTIYGNGLGRFLTLIIGEQHAVFARTLGAMAFSTFVFDTLDVSTRLGRYILQELFGRRGRAAAALATAVTCAVPLALVVTAGTGAWRQFWTLFGTSNQLLAALSLLGVSVWLKRTGRPYWFTLAPMIFVAGVTLTALVLQIAAGLQPLAAATARLNALVAAVLLGLAATLIALGTRALRNGVPAPLTGQPAR